MDTSPSLDQIYEAYKASHGTEPNQSDKELIKRAYTFAQSAHEGHVRASGEPYFNHVFETARNCARFAMDTRTIVAGFLHDTIEDTKTTPEDIKEEFGPEVLCLVEGVTKLGKVKYRGKERSIESLRKFFLAVADDMRVVVIKLADRLHNVMTLEHLRPDKAHRIALETIEIHAPLAHRLGMGKLRNELEEYAFPYAFPKEYEMVSKLKKERKQADEKYAQKVYKSLMKEMALHHIPHIHTDYRVKHKYSLWKKLQRKDMDINKIYDIVALRVIVPTVADCYRVLGLIHGMWRPLPGRIKDYIALPKTNGYQSIHTTIFTGDGGITEIQIRTEAMHRQAEYGFASHFAYKVAKHSKSQKSESREFPWLTDLKNLQEEESDPKKLYENLRGDFFGHRIFVFTPKGDIVDLPSGSSVLDFAFVVHSEVGLHAVGATVNGKFSALKAELHNGDIVEIEHRKDAQPSTKWLDFVKTSVARKYLRQHFNKRGNSLLDRLLSFGQ